MHANPPDSFMYERTQRCRLDLFQCCYAARNYRFWYFNWKVYDIISYSLFVDADMGIYSHAASQYHTQPKAKHGIAMLSVDKFPYQWKQTKGNEFIPPKMFPQP